MQSAWPCSYHRRRLYKAQAPWGLRVEIKAPEVSGLFPSSLRGPEKEMYTVFNCGIGFAVILDKSEADKAIKTAKKHGINAFEIGSVNDSGSIKVNGVVL